VQGVTAGRDRPISDCLEGIAIMDIDERNALGRKIRHALKGAKRTSTGSLNSFDIAACASASDHWYGCPSTASLRTLFLRWIVVPNSSSYVATRSKRDGASLLSDAHWFADPKMHDMQLTRPHPRR
jgi:hypothetical protein